MIHIVFFSYFGTFALGVALVGLFSYMYLKYRTGLYKYCALSVLALTAHFFNLFLQYYLYINHLISNLSAFIVIFIMFSISSTLLINFFPLIIYYTSDIRYLKKIKLMSISLTIVAIVSFLCYFLFNRPFLALYGINIPIFSVILFSIIIFAVNLKKEKNEKILKIKKTYLTVVLIAIPILFLISFIDTMQPSMKNFLFIDLGYPAFFLIFNILGIYYFLRYHPEKKRERDIAVNDTFIKKCNITKRESQIISLLLKGHSYDEIASQLTISMPTVKTHVSNVYKKIGIRNKIELLNAVKSCN